MIYKAGEEIKTGSFVFLNDDGEIKLSHIPEAPVATALHDIKEGDFVTYSPNNNTEDFKVKGSTFRILDGCYNCANMCDLTDWEEDERFVCLLLYPELKDANWVPLDLKVEYQDSHGICDNHKLGDCSYPGKP